MSDAPQYTPLPADPFAEGYCLGLGPGRRCTAPVGVYESYCPDCAALVRSIRAQAAREAKP